MKKSTLAITGGYALMVILGFIGVPKQTIAVYAIAFVIYTALYWLAVYYIKKIHEGSKP